MRYEFHARINHGEFFERIIAVASCFAPVGKGKNWSSRVSFPRAEYQHGSARIPPGFQPGPALGKK
jgi:hypothetical protein